MLMNQSCHTIYNMNQVWAGDLLYDQDMENNLIFASNVDMVKNDMKGEKRMPQVIEEIYEGGVLKPTQPLDISEHTRFGLLGHEYAFVAQARRFNGFWTTDSHGFLFYA